MTSHSRRRKQKEELTRLRMEAITKLFDVLEQWVGRRISITECITRNAPSKDRHHSTTTVFSMELERANFQFSGAQIVISGMEQELYGISMDLVSEWNVDMENELHVTEQFTSSIARYTRIILHE